MNKKHDAIVYIGRFQIFHNAHLATIERAAKLTDNIVIVVGSAKQARSIRNPFTAAERIAVIKSATKHINAKIHIVQVMDNLYNDTAWVTSVQDQVNKTSLSTREAEWESIGIIGHLKDDSSAYLAMFPQWNFIDVGQLAEIHSTNIRKDFFQEQFITFHEKNSIIIPTQSTEFLSAFHGSTAYNQLKSEIEYITAYKKPYESLPYPIIFSTADAVVIQSGNIILIKRRSLPGKGLWALPGGFVNANTDRSVQDAMSRELREETGLKVPMPVLIGNIERSKVFDAIDRSPRGRIITHAFKIVLPDGPLPKIKGRDDAEKAKWVPIASIKPEEMFEDHFSIIQEMVG